MWVKSEKHFLANYPSEPIFLIIVELIQLTSSIQPVQNYQIYNHSKDLNYIFDPVGNSKRLSGQVIFIFKH